MPAETINLIVTQDFNITTTMAFVDPFRVANYINGAPLLSLGVCVGTGGHLRSSNGAMLQTVPMQTISTPADYTIVSASWTPEAHVSAMMKAHLRAAKSKNKSSAHWIQAPLSGPLRGVRGISGNRALRTYRRLSGTVPKYHRVRGALGHGP